MNATPVKREPTWHRGFHTAHAGTASWLHVTLC